MRKKFRIAVIGAGIQGVCNALYLQKKGFEVTLFDKYEPGNSASYGNAGHFSPYASVSLNRPDVLLDVPATSFEMELCAKNDSMVCKIFIKLF